MIENIENKKKEAIHRELDKVRKEGTNFSGKKYYHISLKEIKKIARKLQTRSREIEILALQNGVIPERYHRNLGILSPLEQVKMLQSKVAIIGAGGLGGTVLELLARIGIGKLIIADQDIMVESNLNRQLLSTESNLGQSKIEVAVKRVKKINSSIEIVGYSISVDSDNVKRIIEGAEVVIDALDNLPSRFVLQKACRDLKIPLVHGAIAGFNGQLSTIFPEDKGLELIYGRNKDLPEHGSELELGAPTITPAMIASWEAQEVIKILLKRGKLFRNKLLYFDIEEGMIEILNLQESNLAKNIKGSNITWAKKK